MTKSHTYTKLFSKWVTKRKYFEKHLEVVSNELGGVKIAIGEFLLL